MTARHRQTMTKLFRDHVVKLELAADGRLFSGIRGVELPAITCRRNWVKARQVVLTAAEQDHRGAGTCTGDGGGAGSVLAQRFGDPPLGQLVLADDAPWRKSAGAHRRCGQPIPRPGWGRRRRSATWIGKRAAGRKAAGPAAMLVPLPGISLATMRQVAAFVEADVGMASDHTTAAWVFDLDLWGRCGQRQDEQQALAELVAAIGGEVQLSVTERISGDEQAFDRDRQPATGAERAVTLEILTAARQQTLRC
jgi:hypothetical protein